MRKTPAWAAVGVQACALRCRRDRPGEAGRRGRRGRAGYRHRSLRKLRAAIPGGAAFARVEADHGQHWCGPGRRLAGGGVPASRRAGALCCGLFDATGCLLPCLEARRGVERGAGRVALRGLFRLKRGTVPLVSPRGARRVAGGLQTWPAVMSPAPAGARLSPLQTVDPCRPARGGVYVTSVVSSAPRRTCTAAGRGGRLTKPDLTPRLNNRTPAAVPAWVARAAARSVSFHRRSKISQTVLI